MRRVPVLTAVVAAVAAAVAVAVAPAGDLRAARQTETVIVSNTNPKPVHTKMALNWRHAYRITVSGTVSDWCPETAKTAADCSLGSPLQIGKGVDALYCYASWHASCKKPVLWRQLRIGGKGLDEFTGQPGKIPYSSSHRYAAVVHNVGIEPFLDLVAADALGGGSTVDNSGSFTVEIEDLGLEEKPKVGPGRQTVPVLAETTGDVRVRRNGALVRVGSGDQVKAGTEVHTYWNGSTVVNLPPIKHDPFAPTIRPHIRVPPMTIVVIGGSKGGSHYGWNIEVKTGGPVRIWGDVDAVGSTASVGTQGTVYSVSSDAATGATVVSVESGTVRVTPNNPRLPAVTLRPNQEVQVTRTTESRVASIGHAGAPPGAVTRTKAWSLVKAVVDRNLRVCNLRVSASGILPTAQGWRVTLAVTGRVSGAAVWDVVGSRAIAASSAAKRIAAGCGGGAQTVVATPAQAIAVVKALLERNAAACELAWSEITAQGSPGNWRVVAEVTVAGRPGSAHWTITGAKPVPADPLAAEITAGCV